MTNGNGSPVVTGPEPSEAGRRGIYALLFGILAVFSTLALPLLLGHVYAICDLGAQTMPFKFFYSQCLHRGDDFSWCPHVYCGFYLHGEGQIAMYHPLNLVLYSLLPWKVAYGTELLFRYAFVLSGGYVLLRRWSLQSNAALFGAVTFALGGFNLLHFLHLCVVEVAAHIPWVLVSIDVIVRSTSTRNRAWSWFALVLLTTSEILFGYQQCVFFSLVVEGCYVLFLLVSFPKGTRATLLALLLAKLLGLAGGAVQLVPSWEAYAGSYRSDTTTAFSNTFSLHPYNIVQLFSPYFFQGRFYTADSLPGNLPEMGLYNGSVVTVLLLWVVLRFPNLGVYRGITIGLFLVLAASLLLAFGEYGVIYKLQTMLPLVGHFRAPCRYILIVHLCMAGLAAIAAQDVIQTGRTTKREPCALWVLMVIPAVLGFMPTGYDISTAKQLARVGAGALLSATALLLTVAVARGRSGFIPVLFLFAVADQGVYGIQYLWSSGVPTYEAYVESTPAPPDPTAARISVGGDTSAHIFRDLRAVDGWAGMWPKKALNYRSEHALQAAGVEWVFPDDSDTTTAVRRADWTKLSDPAPFAYLVSHTILSDDPARAIRETNWRRAVVVYENLGLTESAPGTARLIRQRPGEIDIETVADESQLLVVTESFHAGWRVTIDGNAGQVVKVNGDYQGCVVPKGSHHVRFMFRPRSLEVGTTIAAVALTTSVTVLLVWLVLTRATPQPIPTTTSYFLLSGR